MNCNKNRILNSRLSFYLPFDFSLSMRHVLKYNRSSRWDLKFLGVSLTRRFAPGYKYFAPAGRFEPGVPSDSQITYHVSPIKNVSFQSTYPPQGGSNDRGQIIHDLASIQYSRVIGISASLRPVSKFPVPSSKFRITFVFIFK